MTLLPKTNIIIFRIVQYFSKRYHRLLQKFLQDNIVIFVNASHS